MNQPTEDNIQELADLLMHMVTAIVREPDAVDIVASRTAHTVVLDLLVDNDDAKFVVGRDGVTMDAINRILYMASKTMQVRVRLVFLNRRDEQYIA